MNLFQKLWKNIKRNFDIYLTIVIAIVVAILGIFGIVNSTVISSAVLATLALVSSSLLVNRRENDDLRSELTNLTPKYSIIGRLFNPEYDIADVIQQIRNSRVIYLWGTALTTHIPLLRDEIKQGLQKGLEIKFLLIKPHSSAVRMAVFRANNADEDELNNALERNLAILYSLKKEVPDGKLEYKVVDYLAPYAMQCFDPHLSQGIIRIILSTFKLKSILFRPSFKINRTDDEKWFIYFVEQFELIWDTAEIYEK